MWMRHRKTTKRVAAVIKVKFLSFITRIWRAQTTKVRSPLNIKVKLTILILGKGSVLLVFR
jgi:hypothetical protein